MFKQLLITILLGVAITLGYAIYLQKNQPTISSPSPTPTASVSSREADEAFLLSITDQSSEEDKRKHYLLAARMAQTADELKIKDCHPDPLVVSVRSGTALKIKNEDAMQYTLGFNEALRVTVPAHATKEFSGIVGMRPALYGYGYGCDQGTVGKGFVLIMP